MCNPARMINGLYAPEIKTVFPGGKRDKTTPERQRAQKKIGPKNIIYRAFDPWNFCEKSGIL